MPSRGQHLQALASSIHVVGFFDLAYRALQPEEIVPSRIGEPSPTLGWRLKKNAVGTSSRSGHLVEYRVNAKGLRDDETTYEKPPGTFRIAVIGDSRTFGYGVMIGQHYSRLLEGYFEDLEVINLGVSGYGIDQSFLFLQEEGFRYSPDLVIAYVAHFGDHRHVHRVRWGKPKPRFQLVDGRLVLEPPPFAAQAGSLGLLRRIDQKLMDTDPLYRDATQGFFRLLKGTPPDADQKSGDRAAATSTEYVDSMFALAVAILQGIDTAARERGAEFLLVTEIARLDAEVRAVGLRSLDVAAALANDAFELPDGLEHINEAGNGVLAWEIARHLASEGLVPARHGRVLDDGPRF
ncbi:MAG: SGNH/GDSL hydrolase family protein [Myxococcota bacterium]